MELRAESTSQCGLVLSVRLYRLIMRTTIPKELSFIMKLNNVRLMNSFQWNSNVLSLFAITMTIHANYSLAPHFASINGSKQVHRLSNLIPSFHLI